MHINRLYLMSHKSSPSAYSCLNRKTPSRLFYGVFLPDFQVLFLKQQCVLPVCSPFIQEQSPDMVHLQSKHKYQSSCCINVTPPTSRPCALTVSCKESATPVPKIDKRADNEMTGQFRDGLNT